MKLSKSLFNGGISHNKELWAMHNRDAEDSSTGAAYYINDAVEIVTVAAESPLYFDRRFWNVPSFANYLTNPMSPTTQTTETLGTGNYTLWMRGSGSVAVSENTATIIGAGSAVDETSLHFVVTVDGTVNVTVTGECSVFQLTDTIFSIEPFLVNGLSTMASRSGTIYAPMEVGDKLYSLLGGRADGEEHLSVSTTDFSTWTIQSSSVCLEHDSENNRWKYGLTSTTGRGVSGPIDLAEGDVGQVTIAIQAITDTTLTIRIGYIGGVNQNFSLSADVYTVLTFRGIVGSSCNIYFYDSSGKIGDRFYIYQINVESVSVASFRQTFKLTPYFDSTDVPISTTANILHAGTQAMLQFRTDASGNGYIDLKDGTNTASVALDWEYGTEYSIEILAGYNDDESAYKMQLIVDSTASTLTDFDESFDPDTEMVVGYNNDYLFKITPPKFYTLKQRDWS